MSGEGLIVRRLKMVAAIGALSLLVLAAVAVVLTGLWRAGDAVLVDRIVSVDGSSLLPPAGWTQYDVEAVPDGEIVPLFTLASHELTGAIDLDVCVRLHDETDRGAYLRIDEIPPGDGLPIQNAPSRPAAFDGTWPDTVQTGCTGADPDFDTHVGEFWEASRQFRVTVGIADDASPETRTGVWEALNSFQVEQAPQRRPVAVPAVNGTWSTPRTDLTGSFLTPTVVPFGTELFVLDTENYGNEIYGEIYDAESGTLRPMGESQQPWRSRPSAAWTGEELLLIGGSSGVQLVDQVLSYDPVDDEWRTGPNPPTDEWLGPGVWADGRFLFWISGMAYDPAAESWTSIKPYPLVIGSGAVAVWTGNELVVWGGCDLEIPQCDDVGEGLLVSGASFDPLTGSWRQVPRSPLAAGAHPRGVWTGTEVVIYAGLSESGSDGVEVAAFDPETDSWRVLSDPPLEPRRYAEMVWTGEQVLIWGGSSTATWGDGAALDPVSSEWRYIHEPDDSIARDRHGVAFVGGDLFIVGGVPSGMPWVFQLETEE